MANLEYVVPESVQQVCSLLSEYRGEAKVIAGGQSLMILMKHRLVRPSCLVDLKALSQLDYLSFDEQDGLSIGALATHRTIENSPTIKKHYPVLSVAEQTLATIQIRNYGTVGGNLCHADPSSDLAPPLIALGAKVKLSNSDGTRMIPLEDFFVDYYETVLHEDEILTEIGVPAPRANSFSVYRKLSPRKTDAALVGGAAVINFEAESRVCKDVRLVLCAVAQVPLRIKKAEDRLKGERIREDLIEEVSRMASEEARPISDLRASEGYKRELVRVLVSRLLREIAAKS